MRPPRRTPTTTLALAIAAVVAACGELEPGPRDQIVEGVNLTALFAPPTEPEIAAVLAGWAGRTPTVDDIRVEATFARTVAGRAATLRVVSVVTDGHRHFGGIQAADDAPPGTLPILVYAHGGDQGTGSAEMDLLAAALDDIAGDFVLAAPAFRSEPFVADGQVFRSEGEPSPWDRDVDDALAFVDGVAATVPAADPTRVAVLGFSRGGGVALLMGIRDPGIGQVVEFFGPTDFFSDWTRAIVAQALRGTAPPLPGVEWLDEQLIQPLRRGELTIDDVRPELIRRSSVLFADRLPATQLHHGARDAIVPVTQASALIDAMDALGRAPPAFEAFLYPNGTHDPTSLTGAIARTREALGRLLPAATTATTATSHAQW